MRGKILMMGAVILMANLTMSAGEREPKTANTPRIDKFLEPARGGILRGVQFNMSVDEVLSVENQALKTRQEKNSLTFSLTPAAAGKPDFSNVTYGFDQEGLSHIKLHSFQTDMDASMQLFYDTKSLFDDLYGNRLTNPEGYPYWVTLDEATGLTFEVTISDSQQHNLSGFVLEYRCIRNPSK